MDTPNTENKPGSAFPTTELGLKNASESSAAPPPPQPAALEYQTLTVEQIINKFQKELEKDAVAYLEESKRVCEYDAVLRDSQRDLAQLTSQTQRLLLEQEQVEQTLLGVGAFQEQLEKTLSQVESQVDELFTSQSHLAPQDADVERERAYQTASAIDTRLEELTESLQTTFGHLTTANQKVFSGEIGNIVTVLNQHQDGLAQLETAARSLELDVTSVGRQLATTRR